MFGRRLRLFVISALALALALASTAAAGTLTFEIAPTATPISQGEAVLVTVTVDCPSGSNVLEAFVYVVQADTASQFAGIPVRCTGHPRKYVVRVQAFPDSPFQSGPARVSGYLLVDTGEAVESVSPSQEIVIR